MVNDHDVHPTISMVGGKTCEVSIMFHVWNLTTCCQHLPPKWPSHVGNTWRIRKGKVPIPIKFTYFTLINQLFTDYFPTCFPLLSWLSHGCSNSIPYFSCMKNICRFVKSPSICLSSWLAISISKTQQSKVGQFTVVSGQRVLIEVDFHSLPDKPWWLINQVFKVLPASHIQQSIIPGYSRL